MSTQKQNEFPAIVVCSTDGNPDFVEVVRSAIGKIDFRDRQQFSELEQSFYKILKAHGSEFAIASLEVLQAECVAAGLEDAKCLKAQVFENIGNQVLSHIPEHFWKELLPYNDVRFSFEGNHVVAKFSALCCPQGRSGPLIFSRRKPKIDIDGAPKTLAFSEHAVERLCERSIPHWKTYAALGQLHALLSRCEYIERCNVHNEEFAFTMFGRCHDDTHRSYVNEVLGADNVDFRGGDLYYRIGYFPAVIENTFIKAKTFLTPGYRRTPECGAIKRSRLPHAVKDDLEGRASNIDTSQLGIYYPGG